MAKQQMSIRPINAAILARVSTPEQRKNSNHIPQLVICRDYCAKRVYRIVIEVVEDMSGAFVLARSKFAELLDMAATGLIQVIVVDVPDRLGRGDAIAKLEYMTQLNGARIEYARGVRDTSTIEGFVADSADKMVSGVERINIARRMMDGKKNRIAEGRVIAPPIRPYGYRIVSERDHRGRKISCTLEIVESEARVIREIYEWCANEAMTSNAIVVRLNERKIPRMCDTDPNLQHTRQTFPQTKFDGWSRASVVQMLRNTLYRGEWRYGKIKTQRIDAPGKIKRITEIKAADDESILTVAVPAIVSVDLWNAAQEQLEENKRKFMHPPIKNYVLRGRIRCGKCHKAMIGCSVRRWRYYKCRNASGEYKNEANQCKSKVLRADFAEAAVWESIRDVMLDPERLWLGVRKSNEENKTARRMLEQAIAAEQAEIDRVHDKEERLLDLFESKGITKEKYFARLAEHQAEIDKHDKEKKRIMDRLGECPVLTPEQEETLQHFQHEIAGRMTDDVPAVDRMQLYDILRVECFYNSDTGEMLISGLFGEVTATVCDMVLPNGTV